MSTSSFQSLDTIVTTQQKNDMGGSEPEPSHLQHSEHSFPIDEIYSKKSPRSFATGCRTSVALANVRRISISSGHSGRKARRANHITGLCFEFFHSDIPVYVRQWFKEIAALNFDPGERITGFTFWQTQETPGDKAQMQRENAGRIAGLRVSKAGTNSKYLEICLQDKSQLLEYSFTENVFEDLVGQCSAWIGF
jgi:hypothetical protein